MKKIYTDIDHLYNKLTFTQDESQKIFCIVKTVFLKYLLENKFIEHIDSLIKENFTINKLIQIWSHDTYDYFKESKLELSEESWTILSEYISEGASLQGYNSNLIGMIYEYVNTLSNKKKKGMFYTPVEIIQHMISLLEVEKDRVFTIIDPACGCGFFLSEIYDTILEVQGHQRSTDILACHTRILKEQLYGIEKDSMAALIAKLILNLKQPTFIPITNIIHNDALLDDVSDITGTASFDYVIGNPPYIGHKLLNKEYSMALKGKYPEIFYDKADISFCFFKRGIELLKDKGTLIYITSRYFLESLNGKGLRKYIKENVRIDQIIDFSGNRVMKGAKVDLAIVSLTKKPFDNHSIVVRKFSKDVSKLKYNCIFKEESNYHMFSIKQDLLEDSGWILINKISKNIMDKIEFHTSSFLHDIAISNQGIITGCDKAFVLHKKDIYKFDHSLLKPWIKNTDIDQYWVEPSDKYLLYTDDLEEIRKSSYEYTHLKPFKERLSSRRECKNGIRKWHMLQWGRNKVNFDKQKIVFPYKAAGNRFAIDKEGCYFSADIYSLVLKDNVCNEYTYEFIVCLLNSKLYEFYFKSFAKKLGGALYEYYPNTLMRLRIPRVNNKINAVFKEYYDNIIYWKALGKNDKLDIILHKVDEYFYEFFGLSEKEKQILINLNKIK